jgi:hypothetical protein
VSTILPCLERECVCVKLPMMLSSASITYPSSLAHHTTNFLADEVPARTVATQEREAESQQEGAKAGAEAEKKEAPKSDKEETRENEIKARWGLAFVTVIIIFSVAFVKATNYIKEAVPKELEEVSFNL